MPVDQCPQANAKNEQDFNTERVTPNACKFSDAVAWIVQIIFKCTKDTSDDYTTGIRPIEE